MNYAMHYKKVIVTFLAIMIIGSNSFVYANEMNQQSIQTETSQESLAELYHKAGLDSPEIIIKALDNLGISKEELQAYIGQGKKVCDILQERDISTISFKKELKKEYSCKIKEAAKNKVITKKETKVLTDLLKERMAN